MVFRVEKTKGFTVMSNYHLRHKTLSMKAKGLLSMILSLPDTWDYTLSGLSVISSEGICAIRNTIHELENRGYIKRRRLRNEKGQVKNTEYVIYEHPQIEEPTLENPALDKPTLENPA